MTDERSVVAANAALGAGDTARGERMLKEILTRPADATDEARLAEKEAALIRLGKLYRDTK